MADPRFSRIVSLACHDLRTPLASVSGFAKTLGRLGGLDEQQAHFVAVIDEAAEEMALLLEQLAVLARIEGGTKNPPIRGSRPVVWARRSGPTSRLFAARWRRWPWLRCVTGRSTESPGRCADES